MVHPHQPSAQMKMNQPAVFRLSLFASLLVITVIFMIIPKQFRPIFLLQDVPNLPIEQIVIPQTRHDTSPVKPLRPSIPIISETEEIADDLTLEAFTLDDYNPWDELPPPPEHSGPKVVFVAYDEPPRPIGGYAAINKNIDYPDIAREAGIEGEVLIRFFVDKKGRVRETVVLDGLPHTGLNEAACEALRKTRFLPAKQRERSVGVWVAITVNFQLHHSSN